MFEDLVFDLAASCTQEPIPLEPSRAVLDKFREEHARKMVTDVDLNRFLLASGQPVGSEEFRAEVVEKHNHAFLMQDVSEDPIGDILALVGNQTPMETRVAHLEEENRQLKQDVAFMKEQFAKFSQQFLKDHPSATDTVEIPELVVAESNKRVITEGASLQQKKKVPNTSTPVDNEASRKPRHPNTRIPFTNTCSGETIAAMLFLTGAITFTFGEEDPKVLLGEAGTADRQRIRADLKARNGDKAHKYCLFRYLDNILDLPEESIARVARYDERKQQCHIPAPSIAVLRRTYEKYPHKLRAFYSLRSVSCLRHTSFDLNAYSKSIKKPMEKLPGIQVCSASARKKTLPTMVKKIHGCGRKTIREVYEITSDLSKLFDYIEAGFEQAVFKKNIVGLPRH